MLRLPASPCPLQSRHDSKTNNFLDLLSWTPFIFPQPRGRTDLMVGPKCGSCTVTGGWARPGWAGLGHAGLLLLRASCLPSFLLPHHSLLPPSLPPSSPFFLSQSGRFSFYLGISLSESFSPPSGCFCPFLCLPPPHHLCLSPCFPFSDHSFPSLLPTSPRPSAGRLSGASSLCAPPPWTPGCAGQTQVLVFPGICCPVAAREGAAGWLGREGGALLGSPRSSGWPLQAGRVQGGQTLV